MLLISSNRNLFPFHRYRLQFFQESREEIQNNKKRAQLPFHMISEVSMSTLFTSINPCVPLRSPPCW